MAECQTVTGSEQRYFEKECNSPKFSSLLRRVTRTKEEKSIILGNKIKKQQQPIDFNYCQ